MRSNQQLGDRLLSPELVCVQGLRNQKPRVLLFSEATKIHQELSGKVV